MKKLLGKTWKRNTFTSLAMFAMGIWLVSMTVWQAALVAVSTFVLIPTIELADEKFAARRRGRSLNRVKIEMLTMVR